MIELENLTKRFGKTIAVDGLTCSVKPGHVTGFLGPNGAGKSTTMRLILGLDLPNSGTATVLGRPYNHHRYPLRLLGALLEAKSFHNARSAYNHLLCLAQSNGLPKQRVGEVLELVGLSSVAKKRAGTFSLGMAQRLGIATAMLGDPSVLLFDEPVNGLDPEGILWVRKFLRSLAKEGKTVLVSSHLMSEMALTADRLIVIGKGRLIAESSVEDFVRQSKLGYVRVNSPEKEKLAQALKASGADVEPTENGAITVTGISNEQVGEIAFKAGVVLHELSVQNASLEEAFMELTHESAEYHAPEVAQAGKSGAQQ